MRLEILGLARSFGGTRALDGIDLSLGAGEVVALLGENGAGKSTLVEILAGGLRPDRGEARLDGAPYRARDARDACARGVAVVHQHLLLVEAFTVADNLRLGVRRGADVDLRSRWRELETGLGVPLPGFAATVADLSIGERQWLEVGRALLLDPRLLLLDEPTALLTPGEADRLFAAVGRLAGGGTAVLFITHRLDEVRRVAGRVVVLRRGRVVAEHPADAPADLLATEMTGELPPAEQAPRHVPARAVARLRRVAAAGRLAPLDLELRAGEIVILAGVDGNGQVAAAERLAGVIRGPGTVEIGGEILVDPEPADLAARGVAVIPGDRTRQGLLPSLSVAENLAVGLRTRRCWMDPATTESAAAGVIERYGVAGRPLQPAGELSGGNQQKVLVARAVERASRVLVAIHPTRGLDVAAQRAVRSELHRAASRDAAVVVVTADLEEARILGDRILVFSRGRVVGEGDGGTPTSVLARWVGGEAA